MARPPTSVRRRSENKNSRDGQPDSTVRNHTTPPGESLYGRKRWDWTEFKGKRFVRIYSPGTLSLVRGQIRTTDVTIEFLNEIEWFWRNNDRVLIDCSDLRHFTTDATLALFSLIRQNTPESWVTMPRRNAVSEKLSQCGLFIDGGKKMIRPNRMKKGHMTRSNTSVGFRGEEFDAITARSFTHFATKHLFGKARDAFPLQSVLSECMLNVLQHAGEAGEANEDWFLSAFYDEENKVVRFNFLDNGVGILRKIRGMWRKKYPEKKIEWDADTDLLAAVLNNKIPSLKMGGELGGSGLPNIKARINAGQIDNFVILANNTLGRISQNVYLNTHEEFNGSLLHWEVGLDQRQYTKNKVT